ncbi:MAG: carbamoyltransferase HypF, partial [Chloroflexota bacterium]|nr:carbamoyltransferase HypF [Chloroflexota bacterium]
MRAGVSALRVQVTGQVQGVGFRPFVHRLALRHRLGGWVRNESGAVEITVEGGDGELAAFLRSLEAEAPPLARIEAVRSEPCAPAGSDRFSILDSVVQEDRRQPVPPDTALCAACEAELFDPASRRYRYPFITCTDCGPRFTLIESLPYDRERTSMRAFGQCAECLREYHDPGDRRYRSETNSCPSCGPRVWLEAPGGGPEAYGENAIAAAGELLRSGRVIAVRGLGGFHLAVDATDESAVVRLRGRKRRQAKPLAVMVRTVAEARALAQPSDQEAAWLSSPERPIVLLQLGGATALAPSVAPGLDRVGVMLAYTPLHHLLLERAGRPLVMTSGNRSDEPIATGNAEARRRLHGIADGFLLHDREIVARYDDSVVRLAGAAPVLLRRARGYAPSPLQLPVASPVPLVAVGPHLKNTVTLVHGDRAWVSQHVG